MSSILCGAAVVGQSGGPTAAINASLAGVIEACILHSDVITKVYGMKNGIEGFLEERLVELNPLFTKEGGFPDTDGALKMLENTPASALGSCRKKLPKPADDPGFFENLVSLFKKYVGTT
ncbi:MAG: 6-phosphofructokinase [Clostridia bacterium]|nr:6-phosphofructokinase [Clostridia bacterium]